jgi:hypothetical protein
MSESKRTDPRVSGRFAYGGLERIIHERARLSILTSLAAHSELQVLKDAKLVEIWKGVKNNRPQTLCRLTGNGRRRFLEYISELENVVADAASAARAGDAAKITDRTIKPRAATA